MVNNSSINTFIQSFDKVKAASTGGFHSLLIKDDGTVWATGYNYYGQLGTKDRKDRNTWTLIFVDQSSQ